MMQNLHWSKAAPGVWRAIIGDPSGLNPLSVLDELPKLGALQRLGDPPFPIQEDQIHLESAAARKIVRFPLHEREKVFGMGLQFMRMNQRGRTRYLRVNSDPRQDTGETHAPVPFYVTDRGYGVLVNTSRIVTIYCGSTVRMEDSRKEDVLDRNTDKKWRATPVSGRIEIVLPAEGAELLLFAGKSALEVVQRYNLYSGGGTLPPRWGLGFWHRVPKLFSAEEVLKEAMEFRKRDFPCDVIGLEPGWHSRSYPVTYEWSRDRFPDPAGFVKRMADEGFRINLWEHPYVSPESELYEPLRPLSGSYTVWGGLAPDYALREARALYKEQHERAHVEIGVSGYKLDECDGSELTGNSWMFPAHAQFPSGHDGEQMRQLYGLMFQRMTADLFRKRNLRTYGLVRASGAGAAPLPYVLYSDLYDHRQFVRALCNASFCGLLWTPEVRRAKDPEDWARRMQTVVFSPLAMLNAWGGRNETLVLSGSRMRHPALYQTAHAAFAISLFRICTLPFRRHSAFSGDAARRSWPDSFRT
jgi:alpha-D-xyloside xylohydrolase